MRKQEIISHSQQVVSKFLLLSHPRVSISPFCITRLCIYNIGWIYPCLFCTMKNHGLICRIPPKVNSLQTDSLRIKMRPCLFFPFVQFLFSNQLLRLHHHFWAAALKSWNSSCHVENERQQLSEPAFDAFDLFPCTKIKKKKKSMLASCTLGGFTVS